MWVLNTTQLCSVDQLIRLETFIRIKMKEKQHVIVIFFDLSNAFDTVSHEGLLYKYARLGIKGRMLTILRDYFSQRSFRVVLGDTYSRKFNIKRGTPQGSILSTLGYSVYTYDVPRKPDVMISEFADDTAFYVAAKSLREAEQKLQPQVNAFIEWCSKWDLNINAGKTKVMHFHTSRTHTPPCIDISGQLAEVKSNHKFLGLIFDSPHLLWTDHVKSLQSQCLQRISLLKSLSSIHWGADKMVLLQFYRAYILGKINYGVQIYGSASFHTKKPLDIIQNTCLRIILGVRRSSPILSLLGEAGIHPLQYHRDKATMKSFLKMQALPETHPLKSMFLNVRHKVQNTDWTISNKAPFFFRATGLLNKYSVRPKIEVTGIVPVFPPWASFSAPVSVELNIAADPAYPFIPQLLFEEFIKEVFPSFTYMFTDGSKIQSPTISSSSAIFISNTLQCFSWKLHGSHSIIVAELFAILKALETIQTQKLSKVVIFSDSKSGLQLLQHQYPTPWNYRSLVECILISLRDLQSMGSIVFFQWVPGHAGIIGNEKADMLAKAAHSLPFVTDLSLHPVDLYSVCEHALSKDYREDWETKVIGTFYGHVKPKFQFWPWAFSPHRLLDSVLARLRTGHVGLKYFLYRIGKADNPYCFFCPQLRETISHFLLHCNHTLPERRVMQQSLQSIQVPNMTLRILLGGGDFSPFVQKRIREIMFHFLLTTGRIRDL